jgi:hypothetical protein
MQHNGSEQHRTPADLFKTSDGDHIPMPMTVEEAVSILNRMGEAIYTITSHATITRTSTTTTPTTPTINSRAGEPWDAAEDDQLRAEYRRHDTFKSMRIAHGRTHGAITARLEKLGLIGGTESEMTI